MIILPLYTLVFTLLLSVIIIIKSLDEGKFYKNRLGLSFILIFVILMLSLFYNDIKKSDFWFNFTNYSMYAINFVVACLILFNFLKKPLKNYYFKAYLDNIDDNLWLLFLNKKLNITYTSKLLANYNNSKINNVLDDYNIISINDKAFNNEMVLNFLNSNNLENKLNLKIKYLNKDLTEGFIILDLIVVSHNNKIKGYIIKEKALEITRAYETHDINDLRVASLIDTALKGLIILNYEVDSVWLNDYLVKELKLIGNSFTQVDFFNLMEVNDYKAFLNIVNNLTPNNNKFHTFVKIKKENNYLYLELKGEMLFDGLKRLELIMQAYLHQAYNYMKTNSIIDSLKEENELIVDINTLMASNSTFEVVYFRFGNIIEINDKYNRTLGTLVIEEYVNTLSKLFVSDDKFYRLSGLDFCFIITDIRKMENFRKVITSKNILTPSLTYGSDTIDLSVYMGITFSNEAIHKEDVLKNAKNALLKAISKDVHYLFYQNYND